MSPERQQVAARVAKRVARWYAARVWWAEPDDLLQEAWVTVLECDRSAPDAMPELWGGYAYRAASMHLSRYCWSLSAPVSAAKPGPELAGVHRAVLPERGVVRPLPGPQRASWVLSAGTDPEAELLRREAAMLLPEAEERLRARCEELAMAEGDAVHAALDVLLCGDRPMEAARFYGLSRPVVYKATELTKAACVSDPEVRRFAAEVLERRADSDE